MLTQIINGTILTPQGWVKEGSVLISDNKILEVTNNSLAIIGAKVIDAKGMYILPGFVAMNIYGGGGHDFKECTQEAFRTITETHLKYGATTIFPTLHCSPANVIYKAIEVCEELMKEEGSQIMGLHIVGPYINPKMAGSHKVKNPDRDEYTAIVNSTDCIKRWDSSPELPGALQFATFLQSRGIVAAITHTLAEYDEIKAAYEAGYTHAANFYNSMIGFHKRQEYKFEGTIESVYLMDNMTIGVIADGKHLPHTILRLAYKLKGVERTSLVTDALKYAGSNVQPGPDSPIVIDDGVCKTRDLSSLAGSIATMDVLVRTCVKKAAIPLEDAVRMASETPAKVMGVYDTKGSLERGKDADIVIMDKDLAIKAVWSMGNFVEQANSMF